MTEVKVVLSENDVGFGNLAGALSGRLPGWNARCMLSELRECCRVLAAQSTKLALLRFQLELLSLLSFTPVPQGRLLRASRVFSEFPCQRYRTGMTITDANGHKSLNVDRQIFRRLVIERLVPSSNALISIYAMVQRAADTWLSILEYVWNAPHVPSISEWWIPGWWACFSGGYYRNYRRGGGLKPGGGWLPGAPGKPGGN